MKIVSISTYDISSQKTSILYPEASYYYPADWRRYWGIQTIIADAVNAKKVDTGLPPLLCKSNDNLFHYLIKNEKTNQILHFSVDEKLNFSANIIFDTIKNHLCQDNSSDINTFVNALNDVHCLNEAPKKSTSSPTNSHTTTIKELNERRKTPSPLKPTMDNTSSSSPTQDHVSVTARTPTSVDPILAKTKELEAQNHSFTLHAKTEHETHESFLHRLLRFFSYFLCCMHNDADPETEPTPSQEDNHTSSSLKRRV